MYKKFTIEAKSLKNIILFNPESGHTDLSNNENSIFIKVASGVLVFEILSFRYLLTGNETIQSNENIEMILPLKRLQDIIKSFSDDTKITFKEENEKTVSLEADGIKFKIKTCEQENRNQINNIKGTEYKINKEEFLNNIKKVKFAMGDDEVRYYLNGIHIELYKDKENNYRTFMVATNGYVLAISGEKDKEWELIHQATMPKKVIQEIIKILEKAEQEVLISFTEKTMNIKTENLEILLKLIEADFPCYDRIIPYDNSKKAIINTSSLKDMINKVSIISNEKNKNIKLLMKQNNIIVETETSNGNTANGSINANYSDEDMEIVLNTKYLSNTLNQVDEENIEIKLEDRKKQLLIQQEVNKNLLFVIMPIVL